ncbi:MAG: NAD(P)H-hydrate dehydratase [Rhodovibrionaceae bacterium]|nr:NAD(P)H-hydrate dehydratase [Rhodovibrionaceae bacterium]
MACELLTTDEMYRADRAAVKAGTPGKDLMDNAGHAIARAIQERWSPRPVAVLAGPGNNGGDGFVTARLLSEAGWKVRLGLLGERGKLKGDAAHHAGLWEGEVEALDPGLLDDAKLVIDALFGAGLDRPLEGAPRDLAEGCSARKLQVVSVDVPSGVSGDTGELVGEVAVEAALTVTFFRKKPGHLLYPARAHAGEVVLADIGIPDKVLRDIAPACFENLPALWRSKLNWRRPQSHKYDYGHALIVGGSEVTGAARLASRGALRVGAGLVSVAAPGEALAIYASDMPSVITRSLDLDGDIDALLSDHRLNAVLIGPGNGVNATTRERALAALQSGRGVVLDADALSVFAADAPSLAAARAGNCVLTPHDGEFARVFPDVGGDRLTRARVAAHATGAVVLLKGADTVVAAPDGRASINASAPPELATAGAGDVLAGMVAGLLAQGLPAFEAASAAVWMHGASAARLGPGLIAEDLPPEIPAVLKSLRKLS